MHGLTSCWQQTLRQPFQPLTRKSGVLEMRHTWLADRLLVLIAATDVPPGMVGVGAALLASADDANGRTLYPVTVSAHPGRAAAGTAPSHCMCGHFQLRLCRHSTASALTITVVEVHARVRRRPCIYLRQSAPRSARWCDPCGSCAGRG